MESSADRNALLGAMADYLAGRVLGHPLRVAVDGITASGKSTIADELALELEQRGRSTIPVSMDGFHHRRDHRYRQGTASGDGYYEDAYDFDGARRGLLDPLGPGGDLRYLRRIIDLATAMHRGVKRDASRLGGRAAATSAFRDRYHAAGRRYLGEVDPLTRASVVVDNTDLRHPSVSFNPGPH